MTLIASFLAGSLLSLLIPTLLLLALLVWYLRFLRRVPEPTGGPEATVSPTPVAPGGLEDGGTELSHTPGEG